MDLQSRGVVDMSWTACIRLVIAAVRAAPELAGELLVEVGDLGPEPGDFFPVGVQLLAERVEYERR